MPMTDGGKPLPTEYQCRWCDDATGSFHALSRHAQREHPEELRAALTKEDRSWELTQDLSSVPW